MKKLIILCLLLSCIGCGFHLRGNIQIPSWLKYIYITPDDPYQQLQHEIRAQFNRHKVTIVKAPNKDSINLELIGPNFSESILALNAEGQLIRFRLTASMQYKLTYENNIIKAVTTIQSSRDLTLPPELVLSGENEKLATQYELLQDITSQLFRQLTAITLPECYESRVIK